MKRTRQYDEKNRLYFLFTLIDSEGRFTINDTSYSVDVNDLENFTVFKRPMCIVEREHPPFLPHMSHDEYRRRYATTDFANLAGELKFELSRPAPNRVVVVGKYYPDPRYPLLIEQVAEGTLSLGIRARVTRDELIDIVTWDLAHLPERVLRQREFGKPPLNTTLFVSSNQGYTWFPAMFLWIGEKTFVWRNMSSGANADNEITNNNNHSYFMWCPVPDGVELKTYNGDNVPDFLRKRSDGNAN